MCSGELMEEGPLPLEGMKVLDLTRFLAGPYATMVLGDMGAEIVKIERFPGGDDARRMSPRVHGESYTFTMANRNKKSVALDLKSDRGREILMRLLADSDAVIENFRPGVTRRLGLDYDTVRAINPSVIYCSITGFGQTGPHRNRAGFDIIAQGVTGFMRMTGHPGDPPVKVGIAINDIAAGSTAVHAILAAYIHRLRSGDGQYIDISLVDAGLAWTMWEAGAYFGSGELPEPTGSRHRRATPYQAYRTADGYVTIGADFGLWERLCTGVLERPDLLHDPRYIDMEARMAHIDELERDIEEVLAHHPTAYWVQKLDQAGVPGGPVLTYDQTLRDEHVLAREMVVDIEHPRIGWMRTLGIPAKLSATPLRIRTAAPWLGQHTDEQLRRIGIPPEEIDRLHDEGVIHDQQRHAEREDG